MREMAWNQDYDNTKWMTTHLKKTSPVQNLTESLCPVPLDDPLPSWELTEAGHVLRNNQIISHWSAPRIWWRHLTTTTRMLWGKLVCSVFLSFCFCEESLVLDMCEVHSGSCSQNMSSYRCPHLGWHSFTWLRSLYCSCFVWRFMHKLSRNLHLTITITIILTLKKVKKKKIRKKWEKIKKNTK